MRDQALASFESAREVTVVWRSFELDPGAPAVRDGEYSAQLAGRYGTSPQGGKALVGRISAAAERAGVQAYLAEGELLSDHATLQRLGEQVGLAGGLVASALVTGAYGEQVRADQAEAARREITAVPAFLLDGRHVVPGAQSPDSMLAALRRARSSGPAAD